MRKKTDFKYKLILKKLRKLIFSQFTKPDQPFMTYDELEQKFSCSRTVLQTAIEELKKEEILISRGRSGLFTNPKSPQYIRFPLSFPYSSEDPEWSLLMATLIMQAHRIEKEEGINIPLYTGVQKGSETFQQLTKEIEDYGIAGWISYKAQREIYSEPGVNRNDLPRIALMPTSHTNFPVRTVTTNALTFWQKAWHWLKEKKCDRIAIMGLTEAPEWTNQGLSAETGLNIPLHWIQSVDRRYPETAFNLIGLLMDYPEDQRPNAIIISDDNLVDPVVAGIMKNGLRLGQDLEVVAHCNWPLISPSNMPIHRIGCDIYTILKKSIAYLRSQRLGDDFDCNCFFAEFFTEDEFLTRSNGE